MGLSDRYGAGMEIAQWAAVAGAAVAAAVAVWQAIVARGARRDAQEAQRIVERQAVAAENAVEQLDRHRDADRRSEAIEAMTELLYREVDIGRDMEAWQGRSLLRFANEKHLVRANALLPPDDAPVAQWIAHQRNFVRNNIDRASGEIAIGQIGPHLALAAKTAAEAVQELITWQRGERDTESFRIRGDG